jgi:dynein heavy chain
MTVFLQIATSAQFMPTAKKFHYQFNLRDFSKIVQNMMLAVPQLYRGSPLNIVRMWAHECMRVFNDRLIVEEDRTTFMNFMRNGFKEFGEFKEEAIMEQPLIYTSFVSACEGHEKAYMPIKGMEHLKGVLENKLAEFNETISQMNLVLFE